MRISMGIGQRAEGRGHRSPLLLSTVFSRVFLFARRRRLQGSEERGILFELMYEAIGIPASLAGAPTTDHTGGGGA